MFDPWVRKIPWRRGWLPTPVFLPGEFHGQRSLVGYRSESLKESDTDSWTTNAFTSQLLFGVGLVSTVGRGELALCTHSASFWISSPCRSAESAEQSSLTLQWGSSVACFKYFIHHSVCSFPRCTCLLKRWSSLTERVDKRQQGTSATNYRYHYSALGEQKKSRKAKPPETTKSSNKIEKGGSLSMDLSREL